MLSTPPLKCAQMTYKAKNVQLRLPMEISCRRLSRVSLIPLSFEQALNVLIKARPKAQKKRRSKKSKKSV